MPAEWKMHKIVAIYRSGDKTSVKNYHPISLLCISKVPGRAIYSTQFPTALCNTNLDFKGMPQLNNSYLSAYYIKQ